MAASRTSLSWLRVGLVVSFVAVIATARLGCAPLGVAERWTYDHMLLPLLSTPENTHEIVIVEVDDRTLADLGERWPLSRSTWARFIERAASHGPSAIVLDVVFDQPADTDAVAFGEAIADRIRATGLSELPAGARLAEHIEREIVRYDADGQLSKAIANAGHVVLGAIYTDAPADISTPPRPASRPLPWTRAPHPAGLTATNVIVSHPRLTVSAWDSGALNVVVDPDGVVRRYPYVVEMGGARYSSLALASLSAHAGGHADQVDQRSLVEADGGTPLLRFRDIATGFPRVSFSDVLLSRGSDAGLGDMLRGKMLFVGATALGVEDKVRTPVENDAPGVVVHATATENLLSGALLASEGMALWVSLIIAALLLTFFAAFCAPGRRARSIVIVGLATVGVHSAMAFGLAEAGYSVARTPSRGPTPSEVTGLLPGGEPLSLEVTVTPMLVGGSVHANCVFRDITARLAHEKRKDDFVSTVNHELRTPITSILGSLQLVDQGAVGPVDPAVGKLITIAVSNGQRLLGLVNDLLDVSALESGKVSYDFEPLILREVVASAVSSSGGLGAGNGVTLALDIGCGDAVVRGNERRLVQVFTNLLSNAVKHAPDGTAVEVTVRATADQVRVEVRDHGPGIPVEARPHLFQKFSQTAAGDGHKRPGTGLGLHIAKSIVTDHGGTIGFDSEVGGGATFYVAFPRLV